MKAQASLFYLYYQQGRRGGTVASFDRKLKVQKGYANNNSQALFWALCI